MPNWQKGRQTDRRTEKSDLIGPSVGQVSNYNQNARSVWDKKKKKLFWDIEKLLYLN